MKTPWPGAGASPAFWIATWGGSGMLPKAPVTWGTLAALPCAYLILLIPGGWALPLATLLVLAAGLWASKIYMENAKTHDPGQIVVDEVVGQWLVLMPLGTLVKPLEWALAFALFRLFDIWKPWPISVADRRVKGAVGVMLDDILAGAVGALIMIGYVHVSR